METYLDHLGLDYWQLQHKASAGFKVAWLQNNDNAKLLFITNFINDTAQNLLLDIAAALKVATADIATLNINAVATTDKEVKSKAEVAALITKHQTTKIVAFGSLAAEVLLPEPAAAVGFKGKIENETQQIVVTYSLKEILQYPTLKAAVWRHLQQLDSN